MHSGIKFLGFTHYITETGKIYLKLDKKNISRERRKLRNMKHLYSLGGISINDICLSYSSWRAHAKKGNSYKVIHNMDKYFIELFFPYIEKKIKSIRLISYTLFLILL